MRAPLETTLTTCAETASEPRGNTCKGFKDLYLKAKNIIWP